MTEHEKVYVVDGHKCFVEGMSKKQIKEEMVSIDGATGKQIKECYSYSHSDDVYINPIRKNIASGEEITVSGESFSILVNTAKYHFKSGDKIVLDGQCIEGNFRTIAIGILTEGEPGDTTITSEEITHQKTYPVYADDQYERIELDINHECTGYAVIMFGQGGGTLSFKNPEIVFDMNIRCAQLKLDGKKIYPSTCEIIKKEGDFPNVEYIRNREEHRYTESSIIEPVTINAELGGSEDFYSVIVSQINMSGTAADLISEESNCKVVNRDLDISDFTVVHITLFYDGINICAVVSGY